MTDQKRNELRALQDAFLGHSRAKTFAATYGNDRPMFGDGTPSYNQLSACLYPDYEARIAHCVSMYTIDDGLESD